jgi:mycothiol synthase
MRPPTPADAAAVAALVIRGDIAELGEADYTLEDLLQEWGESGFDLAHDAVVIEHDGVLAGYAAFRHSSKTVVTADDEDLAPALIDWCERQGRARGHAKFEQAAGARNTRRRELLLARGYAPVRSYWRMDRALHDEHEPEGLRALQPGDDLFALNEAAFGQNADYEPETERTFTEHHLQAHDLDPELSRVEVGLRGFALVKRWPDGVAYLDLLAVHPDAAGQGIGTKLLHGVFARAHARGFARVQLDVASDNAHATRLYERAGMRERFRVDAFARPVPD